ncbi:TM2 domain-containing protein almondex isoform X2 [Trichogramma pretiosum]|uniref:TM2 domain-containing protein n=1 Tax=Trichogramma kaykai TaxID=54128 RepID=A0ABD2XMQ8_9HYME|nr:TM2 domain-containing protein almondex isoform X2 [Trichogramma pretiosum]
MNVVRINSKNVFFILMAILSTSVKQAQLGHGSSQTNFGSNTTSAFEHNWSDSTAVVCPVDKQCSELHVDCLICPMKEDCIYGATYTTNCSVREQVDCVGNKNFTKTYICRYCYQTEPSEHKCLKKNACNSVASPKQYYRSNCTVYGNILCLGNRIFNKNLPCNWTSGYRWSTALILSITLGGFGADRFYLGHWQEGIGKLFSFGGLGVWTLIDVMLISMRYLGPADGSLYIK